ncbi:MAG: SH3 domain-containing protein [Candidatus Eisenbacteria bacterium]
MQGSTLGNRLARAARTGARGAARIAAGIAVRIAARIATRNAYRNAVHISGAQCSCAAALALFSAPAFAQSEPIDSGATGRPLEWFQEDVAAAPSGVDGTSQSLESASSRQPVEWQAEASRPGAVSSVASEEVSTASARSIDGWGYAIPMVRLTGADQNVLRRGPGDEYAIVAVVSKGSEYRVLAKKGDWYSVEISETTSGWVHSALCEEFEDLSHLEMRPNPRLFSRMGAFTLTGYAGGYAYDRKSNSVALGGRIGYYLLDFVEVEGGVSWTHIHRPAEVVESLFNLSLEAEDFHMLYYSLGLRLELLPGRQMVPYLVGGAGASILQGRTESSWNYGGGTTLFLTKTTATRWELRAYRFDAGFDLARRTNHNIEFSFGTSVLF